MFENILIPISSEFYHKEVFHTGVLLAEKFKSKIKLVYIIEEKTLEQAEKITDAYRTHYDMNETKKEIIRKQISTADNIIFNDAKLYFKNKNITFESEIIEGEFSNVIKNQAKIKNCDLVLMGFEKGCMLNYRLIDDIDIPVWVESGNKNKSILAVCSNLAPNQKVPNFSRNLSKLLNWRLHMIYVIDMQDAVIVDTNGRRSEQKSENELISKAKEFISNMEKQDVHVDLVKGSLEKEIEKAADRFRAGVVILGREQKKKTMFGIPVKSVKKKMAETCNYSILFLN